MKSQDDQEQLGSIQKSGHASSAIMNDRKDTISTGTQPTTNREIFLLSADDAICEKMDALKVSKNLPYQIFGKPEEQGDQCQNLPIARMGTNISISTKKDAETVTSALTNTSETSEQWTNRVIKNLPVKPYYSHNGIIIINSDCREILPHLPKVDLVLTDPPYGISHPTNYAERGRGNMARCNDYALVHDDDKPFDPTPFLSVGSAHCFWGGNYYALPPVSGWLVWDKERPHGLDQATAELAWTDFVKGVRVFRHLWNGMMRASEHGENYHPTQKPVELMRWVLSLRWTPTGTVLDPFMGSGTTLRAAKDLGRKAIGIEISEEYCRIAVNRLRQEVLAL